MLKGRSHICCPRKRLERDLAAAKPLPPRRGLCGAGCALCGLGGAACGERLGVRRLCAQISNKPHDALHGLVRAGKGLQGPHSVGQPCGPSNARRSAPTATHTHATRLLPKSAGNLKAVSTTTINALRSEPSCVYTSSFLHAFNRIHCQLPTTRATLIRLRHVATSSARSKKFVQR